MIIKTMAWSLLLVLFNGCTANNAVLQSSSKKEITALFEVNKMGTYLNAGKLPAPYNVLLTQPLMTKSLEDYYQRRAIIRTLYAVKNTNNNTYSRAIQMLIDSNKTRNNPKLAQKKDEAIVAELAFITMNFNALPAKVVSAIQNSTIPFGKLLALNQVKITTADRRYFSLRCNNRLVSLTHCSLGSTLYGRTNTINLADGKTWLAHVVEILP